MLMGKICEDRSIVGDAQHTAELQGMGRRLHHGGLVPGRTHRGERRLELRRAWRRDVGGVAVAQPADPRLHGPHEPAPQPAGRERGDREERGRRLAVGAGDAQNAKVPRGVPVPPPGGDGERPAGVADHDLRDRHPGDDVLDDRGPGARGGRPPDEGVAVHVKPGHGHEHAVLADLPRVVRHASQPGAARAVGLAIGDSGCGHGRQAGRLEALEQGAQRLRLPGLGRGDEALHLARTGLVGHGAPRRRRANRAVPVASSPSRCHSGRRIRAWAPACSTQTAP